MLETILKVTKVIFKKKETILKTIDSDLNHVGQFYINNKKLREMIMEQKPKKIVLVFE